MSLPPTAQSRLCPISCLGPGILYPRVYGKTGKTQCRDALRIAFASDPRLQACKTTLYPSDGSSGTWETNRRSLPSTGSMNASERATSCRGCEKSSYALCTTRG